mgnify:CR=1 FL=1
MQSCYGYRVYFVLPKIKMHFAMKIGSSVERLTEIDSTNNYAAKQLLTNRLPEGAVFVTDCQTVGRGQVNNYWESEPGQNLTFSFVCYPEYLRIDRQFEISKAVSLGVKNFLSRYVAGVSIKWPNDIYIGDKKVAGILIENAIRNGKLSNCIVGIGLNINQLAFVSDAPNPISLRQATGICYDLQEMLALLLAEIDQWYQLLKHGNQMAIDEAYTDSLYRLGQRANYKDEQGPFTGRISGVDAIGRLCIETESGKSMIFHFKEVAFLP